MSGSSNNAHCKILFKIFAGQEKKIGDYKNAVDLTNSVTNISVNSPFMTQNFHSFLCIMISRDQKPTNRVDRIVGLRQSLIFLCFDTSFNVYSKGCASNLCPGHQEMALSCPFFDFFSLQKYNCKYFCRRTKLLGKTKSGTP